ncbi:MAG: hypothetical protein QM635_06140 [Microbacteriaceae bacterium]
MTEPATVPAGPAVEGLAAEDLDSVVRDLRAGDSTDPERLWRLGLRFGSPPELESAHLNVLRTLRLDGRERVLLLGSPWGGRARYLATRVGCLDVVEGSELHARLSRGRVEGHGSVRIVNSVDELDGLLGSSGEGGSTGGGRYDLLIALDPPAGGAAEDAVVDLARRLVAPSGSAVVAAADEHAALRLAERLAGEGVAGDGAAPRALAVIPELSRPRVVLDREPLRRDAPNLAAGLEPPEGTAMPWLLVAPRSARARPPWPPGVLAVYFSSGRRRDQSAMNTVIADERGLRIERRAADPDIPVEPHFVHRVDLDETIVEGRELVELLLESDEVTGAALLRRWSESLDEVDGELRWDLVPHNVIVSAEGFVAIDQEWRVEADEADNDLVRRRGVFWTALRWAADGLAPVWLDTRSVAAASIQLGALVGLPEDGSWLERFFIEEAVGVRGIWPSDRDAVTQIGAHATSLRGLAARGWEGTSRTSRYGGAEPRSEEGGMDGGYLSVAQRVETLEAENQQLRAALSQAEATEADALRRAVEAETGARLSMLSQRDHIVGLEAELVAAHESNARLSAANAGLRQRLRDATKQLKEQRAIVQRQRARIRAIRRSRSYRLGHALAAPLSLLRGRR